jgi:hypothetical protein
MTCTGRKVELCPRSYDDLARAEMAELCVEFQGMPPVSHHPIVQSVSLGVADA